MTKGRGHDSRVVRKFFTSEELREMRFNLSFVMRFAGYRLLIIRGMHQLDWCGNISRERACHRRHNL